MNILLIDDDPGSLDCLQSALELYGYNCKAFTLPVEAVEEYQKNAYDVVITDMRMPLMNGIQVLKKIRSINGEAKVIIITAYGDVETAVSAVNNHACAFFGKPLNFVELIETLKKIEHEREDCKLTREEYDKLTSEHAKLKKAFEDLQKLIKARSEKKKTTRKS